MKKALCVLLATCLAMASFTGCGGNGKDNTTAAAGGNETTAAGDKNTAAADGDVYSGDNAFEACEWAADKYPDAKVIRYTNNTSTGTFESNGGAIPAMVLYLAVNVPIQTEGRYRIELYADGTLAKTVDDIVSGLKSGAFEMNCLSVANFGSYTNAFAEMNVPFLFTDEAQVESILKNGLQDDMCARAEADIEGVLFKGIAPFGFRQMTNNKHEIKGPSDLGGLKMRILTDPLQVAAFEAMGAAVTNVTYSELYTALQQGVVDGEENPFQNLYVDKLCEVQKYCTVTNHLYQMSAQVISESFWNSLSAEDQEIFTRLIEESQEAGFTRVAELVEFYMDECKKSGMEIRELSEAEAAEFKKVMEESVHAKAIESMGQERWDKLNSYLEAASK